jgi:NADPH-dependent 2,4-dienoyl-CoA reductase/sulfur reductase-like enzyme
MAPPSRLKPAHSKPRDLPSATMGGTQMNAASKPRIVVLGAGFGGLELTTLLSDSLGDSIDVTLIDKSDSFVFGFSKLDVMFGHKRPEAVRCRTAITPNQACGY